MKKWHLHEHVLDIFDWWTDVHDWNYWANPDEQQLRFIAYERWLGDRELLTIEDGYEWKFSRPSTDPEKSPAPDRPTHEESWTYSRL